MREFGSIGSFLTQLARVEIEMVAAQEVALDKAAEVIQKAAKKKIGSYQDAAGPFLAWEPLAESTLEEKARLGYGGQVSEDDPLLRTGDMAESIERNSDAFEAYVGSDSDIALYQELGTSKIPPRSFLGGAAVEQTDKVLEIVGETAVLALMGERVTGGAFQIERSYPETISNSE